MIGNNKNIYKKRSLQLYASASIVAVLAVFSSAKLQASQAVTLYQHINFSGSSLSVGEGDVTVADLRASGVGNNRISSIRVAAGYEVLACRPQDLTGRCEIFVNDVPDLRFISFNDTISSLRVTKLPAPLPVTVYQHINFSGKALSVGEGDVPVRNIRRSVGNDTISSISIEPGYEVLACARRLLTGRCETFTASASDLRSFEFNDVISSMRVTRVTTPPPQPVNNPPVASDVEFSTDADNLLTISLSDLLNAVTDADQDSLTVSIPPNSVVTGNSDNTVSFDPTVDFADLPVGQTATVSFVYEVSDGQATDSATVTITIEGTFVEPVVNIPPVASNVEFSTDADTLLTFSLSDLASSVMDSNGDALLLSIPPNQVVTDNGDNTFTFDPTVDFASLPEGDTATVSFPYEVSDGQATDSATVTITIEGTFVAPTFAIGDVGPGGGTVFAVSEDGTSGLEAAPEYIPATAAGEIEWGCFNANVAALLDVPGVFVDPDSGEVFSATFDAVGNLISIGDSLNAVESGEQNTLSLQNAQCDAIAAQEALDYMYTPVLGTTVTDWYLPSIAELIALRTTTDISVMEQGTIVEGNLDNLTFWSSTEHTNERAWALNPSGASTVPRKDAFGSTINVWPIRSF